MHTQNYHSSDRFFPRAITKAVNIISGSKLNRTYSGTYSVHNMVAQLNKTYMLKCNK